LPHSLNDDDFVGREEEVDEEQDEQDSRVAQHHAQHEGFEEVPKADATKPHDQRLCHPAEEDAEAVTVAEPRDSVAGGVTEGMKRKPQKLPTQPSQRHRHQRSRQQVDVVSRRHPQVLRQLRQHRRRHATRVVSRPPTHLRHCRRVDDVQASRVAGQDGDEQRSPHQPEDLPLA